jgi:hypothetical protein
MSKVRQPRLTVLTDPVPHGYELFRENGKRAARYVRDLFVKRNYNNHPVYRGHFAVTRSLVQGLTNINADFNYNPRSVKSISENVIILSGVRTLQQAINLKKAGIIKKIYAGPNIVVFLQDHECILSSVEVDYIVTPSEWIVDLYSEDDSRIRERCVVWPAGVDTEYWKPNNYNKCKRILFFIKQSSSLVCSVDPYIDYIKKRGWNIDIIRYRRYTHDEYLNKLNDSCLLIGFSSSESQGMAWNEAWSANVPTMIWKNDSSVFDGRRFKSSAAPYLNDSNGVFFEGINDFIDKFIKWEGGEIHMSPREWSIKYMSDDVLARKMYNEVLEC